MVAAGTTKRRIRVGTTGWSAADLDNAEFLKFWESGRFEIIEGALIEMPAATYDSSEALFNLLFQLKSHVKRRKIGGSFGVESDVVLSRQRVVRVDATYLSAADREAQAKLYAKAPKRNTKLKFGRLVIAPTLVIEAISLGHEAHDRDTKLAWYAEAGVKHYWILDTFEKSLDCYALATRGYRLNAAGKGNTMIRPSLFPKLAIDLGNVWP